MTAHYLNSLQAVNPATADSEQKMILDKAREQVGFIPNMYANMANLPALLNSYLYGYDLFRKQSGFTSAEQEVVFLAISRVNGCSYCTAAHSMMADRVSGVPKDILQAIRSGQVIHDAKFAALFNLTQAIVRTLGQPDPGTVQPFLKAGYAETQVLAIILAVSVKVLSNYANHAFGTEVDAQFSAYRIS